MDYLGIDLKEFLETADRILNTAILAVVTGEARGHQVMKGLWFDGLITGFMLRDLQERAS
jgi:hypothetical protein